MDDDAFSFLFDVEDPDLADIVRLEAQVIGEPLSSSNRMLFDTVLRTRIVLMQNDDLERLIEDALDLRTENELDPQLKEYLAELILIAGQIHAEAEDYNADVNQADVLAFTHAVNAYLEQRNLNTVDDLLEQEIELLDRYRRARQNW